MSQNGDTLHPAGGATDPQSIRDLSDFCNNWTDLRQWVCEDALNNVSAHANTLATIRWLTLLADRVCYDFDQ